MKSHEYRFTILDLLNLAKVPVAMCFVFTLIIAFGAALEFLPHPRPILDLDRTILIHQIDASRSKTGAEIILIGDSSCLMDLNARELESLTGKRVWNLATLSYVTLEDHLRLLRNYLTNNPDAKTVVLLMHPESLRLPSRPVYFHEVLGMYSAGWDHYVAGESKVLRLLNVYPFKSRLMTRALPIPLASEYGQSYGFNKNLWNHLTRNNGSALDPHTYPSIPPSGNPEYRLAPQLESVSRAFGTNLPTELSLLVGITPSPSDYVYRNHSQTCRAMLETWSEWLKADATLTNLPFVLPPTDFATTTHLNEAGVSEYTRSLAEILRLRN